MLLTQQHLEATVKDIAEDLARSYYHSMRTYLGEHPGTLHRKAKRTRASCIRDEALAFAKDKIPNGNDYKWGESKQLEFLLVNDLIRLVWKKFPSSKPRTQQSLAFMHQMPIEGLDARSRPLNVYVDYQLNETGTWIDGVYLTLRVRGHKLSFRLDYREAAPAVSFPATRIPPTAPASKRVFRKGTKPLSQSDDTN